MDLAGNGAAFNDAELMQIQDIYQRVAEDYAPFDVDVTTEEPPAADLDRTGAGDQVYGTRALISPSTSALNTICGGNCGGVAFIGVFDHYSGKDGFAETHNQLQPAWVFPQALGNDPKNIAEATTHEVGHNFGLDHDGTTVQGYYAGPTRHVGADHGRRLRPADHAVRAERLPGRRSRRPQTRRSRPTPTTSPRSPSSARRFRSDEPGTSIANAGAVPAGLGVHQQPDRRRLLRPRELLGHRDRQREQRAVSPNLDIELQLLNAGGTVIDTDNPPFGLRQPGHRLRHGRLRHLDAAAGRPVLRAGRWHRPRLGTTSYTDYGSVGAYKLQVTGCGGVVTRATGRLRRRRTSPGSTSAATPCS